MASEVGTRRAAVRCVTLLVLLAATAGAGRVERAPAPRAEILWDTWGVPHIFARDTGALFHAFGWAQAEAHGDLLLRLYGRARGRAAEYWGERFVAQDRLVHQMGIPARSREWLKKQRPAFRRYLAAFAAGINAYARRHPDRIADEVEVVLPVEASDMLAHGQQMMLNFLAATGGAAHVLRSPAPPAASNGWAIAPSRSAGGHALLLANPHLPWGGPTTWFEAQLSGPGIDVYGASLVGMPVLAIAFNDYLGWTHTVNTIDACDLYELTAAEGGYRYDGKVRPFRTHTATLRVKQSDGSFREERLEVRRSIHGPVIERDGKTYAIRCAGLDALPAERMAEQSWDMARARSFAEFEKVLRRLQLPMMTVIYADRDGHIMHLFNGRIPVRKQGDFRFWQGTLPGDSPATLWTRHHPYEELPKVIDPPSGWVQNANSPPWVATFPPALDPDDFPAYMAPRFMRLREQHSVRMLAGDRRISFEELIDYKHSTRMELADRILDDLIAAAEQGTPRAGRAASVLRSWDRRSESDSRGAVLFLAWLREMRPTGFEGASLFATSWDPKDPRTTPRGLADPQAAARALDAAAATVEAAYGALDVPYGEVFRLRWGALDLPGNGSPDRTDGTFRVIDYAPAERNRFRSFGGDSYIAAVEFADPVRAMTLVSYGNASQPGSPHNGDQLALAARKALRPVWRTRSEIEAHLETRAVPDGLSERR